MTILYVEHEHGNWFAIPPERIPFRQMRRVHFDESRYLSTEFEWDAVPSIVTFLMACRAAGYDHVSQNMIQAAAAIVQRTGPQRLPNWLPVMRSLTPAGAFLTTSLGSRIMRSEISAVTQSGGIPVVVTAIGGRGVNFPLATVGTHAVAANLIGILTTFSHVSLGVIDLAKAVELSEPGRTAEAWAYFADEVSLRRWMEHPGAAPVDNGQVGESSDAQLRHLDLNPTSETADPG